MAFILPIIRDWFFMPHGTAVDDISFRLMSYDFWAFSGVGDYGYWHLSRRRGRNKRNAERKRYSQLRLIVFFYLGTGS
jgi:hypothetical protein